MPATIQKILKPTKYRAVDTSTGDYYVDEYIVDGNFSSASNWNLGDDWSISSNELILTHAGDTSGNVNQSANNSMGMGLTKGTYQLTWTISAYAGEGSVTARIFGLDSERAPGSARSSNGTFTEILTLDGSNPGTGVLEPNQGGGKYTTAGGVCDILSPIPTFEVLASKNTKLASSVL